MALVERAHQPRQWDGIVVTREDFCRLVQEVQRLVVAETRAVTLTEITMDAYERPFSGVIEFRENVEEREWIELDDIAVAVRPAKAVNGLTVHIVMGVEFGLRLVLSGADRRSRNAIEPDVVTAIESLRRSYDPYFTGSQYVTPWYLAAAAMLGLATTGFIIEVGRAGSLHPGDSSLLLVVCLLGGLLSAITFMGIGTTTRDRIRAALPTCEFLGEDRQCRYDKWKAAWLRTGKLLAQALLLAAAVAGIATFMLAVA